MPEVIFVFIKLQIFGVVEIMVQKHTQTHFRKFGLFESHSYRHKYEISLIRMIKPKVFRNYYFSVSLFVFCMSVHELKQPYCFIFVKNTQTIIAARSLILANNNKSIGPTTEWLVKIKKKAMKKYGYH